MASRALHNAMRLFWILRHRKLRVQNHEFVARVARKRTVRPKHPLETTNKYRQKQMNTSIPQAIPALKLNNAGSRRGTSSFPPDQWSSFVTDNSVTLFGSIPFVRLPVRPSFLLARSLVRYFVRFRPISSCHRCIKRMPNRDWGSACSEWLQVLASVRSAADRFVAVRFRCERMCELRYEFKTT